MTEEYLTRCVVNPLHRTFNLYSSEGTERQVECETIEQFMDVLEVVRSKLDSNTLVYTSPL